MLALFHDSAEPWLLKDMEKAAAKKGVVFQAVKDVVQSLSYVSFKTSHSS